MASELDTTINIIDLATLKTFIEETLTTNDNALERLINAVSAWMNNYTDRHLKSVAVTEYYNGNDLNVMPTKNYPITAVSKVYIDNNYAFGSDTEVPTANILLLGDSEITLKDYIFSKGANNIKITYTSGYVTMPADLKQVALHLCKLLNSRANSDSAGIATINYPNGSVGYVPDRAMPAWCKDILERYVRV